MDENPFINWLLESPIATIRYQTMRELLNLPSDHSDCQAAYKAIQTTGAVPVILNQQVESGQWKYSQHYYTPKFTSTHWSMMLLEELLCDPFEPRFQAAIEFMLSASQKEVEKYQDRGFTCLWGNIIRYCVYAGKLSDPRLQYMIDLTAKSLHTEKCKCDWNWQMSCVWGAARSIWGLISIPEPDRTATVEQAIQSGLEFVLETANLIIDNQPSNVEKKTHQNWYKLNFPLFYQADVLFVLRLLYQIDYLDHPQAVNLVSWLESKQKPNGRWLGSSPFRQRTYKELGGPEETSRWVTLQAASILKKAKLHA
ncbi:MAG: hypothetical protein CVU41_03265 [Chloroflexi bacterium HGW-Chloroflexi-3]|nr:MAG: hypothetical protein CVU41_03265 [Chloroflexi bacterium HGW-Chloroflexi-3]